MQDILERLANSSPNEGSHDLYCRCLDAAQEVSKLRAIFNEIKDEAWHELPTGYEDPTTSENLAHTVYLMAMRGLPSKTAPKEKT